MPFTMEFGTGFETGATNGPLRSGIFSQGGAVMGTGANKHTGTYAIDCTSLSRFWKVAGLPPAGEKYLSLWAKVSSEALCSLAIQFQDAAAAVLVDLRRYGTKLDAYVGANLVANGVVDFDAASFHHIQIHVLIADGAAGVIETIIDGIPDIVYNGDTKPGASTNIEQVQLLVLNNTTGFYADDFCFGAGGWPGDIRFDPVLLSADSAPLDWTPSTPGTHWSLIDETPPVSADYVYALTDVSDRYETPGTWDDTDGMGNVVKDPIAVTVWADVRKQDGNTNDKLQISQKVGANEVVGGYETLLTSYENRWLMRVLAPDAAEWTLAKVNALIVGIDADMA